MLQPHSFLRVFALAIFATWETFPLNIIFLVHYLISLNSLLKYYVPNEAQLAGPIKTVSATTFPAPYPIPEPSLLCPFPPSQLSPYNTLVDRFLCGLYICPQWNVSSMTTCLFFFSIIYHECLEQCLPNWRCSVNIS